MTTVATALLCAFLASAASAQAATAPRIIGTPAITGTPRAGETLTATARWTGDPAPTATWRWLRCSADSRSCVAIKDATADTYVATLADVGSTLRVRLKVTNAAGSDVQRSDCTAVVQVAAPQPRPTPTAPPPQPRPTPTATPAPVVRTAPTLLDPFPVVRIRGVLTARGARINLFTVRGPLGVRVAVRCQGRSCPVQRLARPSTTRRLIRLRVFERYLAARTRLVVKVTQPGRIGKWSTIVIRRGAPPKRSDQCAYPDARLPAPCPRV